MKRRVLISIAVAAGFLLSMAAPALASTPPTSSSVIWDKADPAWNLYISASTGYLTDSGTYWDSFIYNSSDELVDQTSGTGTECLYWNNMVGRYDLKGCSASSASDIWYFYGDTTYGEMTTAYNHDNGECATGPSSSGGVVTAGACSGSAGNDRWTSAG
jgi:hypothetical protein